MPFFKSKQKPSSAPTFKLRVENFWLWWGANSARILESVNENGGASIQKEIIEQVALLGSSFAWVFGPHPDGKEDCHSFTLSPEGNRNYLFLTSYWLSRAPEVRGWYFYSSRQPSNELNGASIQIGDFQLKANELWITTTVDKEENKLDLIAWSPIFREIEESTAYQVLYLLLDEALGENGVSQWLGHIEIKDDQVAHSYPLPELPEQLSLAKKESEWKNISFEESYTLYRFKEPRDHFPRADLISLTTQNPKITLDYFNNEGHLDDPVAKTGASYHFIQIPISQFPRGKEVDLRAEWEDSLEEELARDLSGRVFGGGLGTDYAYIDVLLFDGEKSLQIVQDTLEKNEARKFKIQPFGTGTKS